MGLEAPGEDPWHSSARWDAFAAAQHPLAPRLPCRLDGPMLPMQATLGGHKTDTSETTRATFATIPRRSTPPGGVRCDRELPPKPVNPSERLARLTANCCSKGNSPRCGEADEIGRGAMTNQSLERESGLRETSTDGVCRKESPKLTHDQSPSRLEGAPKFAQPASLSGTSWITVTR
jgi:hypothetical protein